MLAEVFQSQGSHEMEFDGVCQIMVFTLYCSANWKCPKCGENRWAATGRSPAESVGSNPTGGMDISLLWVLCVVR